MSFNVLLIFRKAKTIFHFKDSPANRYSPAEKLGLSLLSGLLTLASPQNRLL